MNFDMILKALGGHPNLNGVGTNLGPLYSQPGIGSIGGSVQLPFGGPQVGGTVGIDNGQPFANANVNHRPANSIEDFLKMLLGK